MTRDGSEGTCKRLGPGVPWRQLVRLCALLSRGVSLRRRSRQSLRLPRLPPREDFRVTLCTFTLLPFAKGSSAGTKGAKGGVAERSAAAPLRP